MTDPLDLDALTRLLVKRDRPVQWDELGALIAAVRERDTRINELWDDLAEHQETVSDLQARVAELERRMNNVSAMVNVLAMDDDYD